LLVRVCQNAGALPSDRDPQRSEPSAELGESLATILPGQHGLGKARGDAQREPPVLVEEDERRLGHLAMGRAAPVAEVRLVLHGLAVEPVLGEVRQILARDHDRALRRLPTSARRPEGGMCSRSRQLLAGHPWSLRGAVTADWPESTATPDSLQRSLATRENA